MSRWLHHTAASRVVAGGRREMHDGVDAVEGRSNRGEVAEIGLVSLDARHGAPVERPQRVFALDVRAERAADEPAQSGHEKSSRCHITPSIGSSGLYESSALAATCAARSGLA